MQWYQAGVCSKTLKGKYIREIGFDRSAFLNPAFKNAQENVQNNLVSLFVNFGFCPILK